MFQTAVALPLRLSGNSSSRSTCVSSVTSAPSLVGSGENNSGFSSFKNIVNSSGFSSFKDIENSSGLSSFKNIEIVQD